MVQFLSLKSIIKRIANAEKTQQKRICVFGADQCKGSLNGSDYWFSTTECLVKVTFISLYIDPHIHLQGYNTIFGGHLFSNGKCSIHKSVAPDHRATH